MKKVFFTAIAMIAFSSASMANTIADDEVVIIRKNENEKVLVVQQANPCKNNFAQALNQAYQMGYNDAQAWNYASVAYIFCTNGLTAPIFNG
jgi:hypothetical protein